MLELPPKLFLGNLSYPPRRPDTKGLEILTRNRPPLVSRRFFGLELLGLVVFLQPLPVFLDESGIRSDLVPLGWGDVAHHVFFLERVCELRSVFEAVGYVVEYLLLYFRVVVGAE